MWRLLVAVSIVVALLAPAPGVAGERPTVRMTLLDGVEHDVPVMTAAEGSAPDGPFGTGFFLTWLGLADFRPINSTIGYTYNFTDGFFYQNNGSAGAFVAPLSLPAGANLAAVRLYYYDNDESAGLLLSLCRTASEGLPPTGTVFTCPYSVSNVTAEMPGYATMALSPGLTFRYAEDLDGNSINNDVNWTVSVSFVGAVSQYNRVRGVRLYWSLQISPAPTTASFTDVPVGNSSFQAVEALKSSGITLGCTATTFCPTQAVTRAQMALFLSRALGLSWNF
jgi:hypothetical protein